jgi:integrase
MSNAQRADGLEPRGNGVWRITVAAGRDPVTGKYRRVRETFYGTKTDARKRRDALRADVGRGIHANGGKENVADYLERWIVHRELSGKLRPATAKTYRGYVRREVVPRIGSMRLREVRPVDVQRVLDACLKRGLAPRSIVQIHRVMHAAFRQAVRWQLLTVNPSDGVNVPKVEAADLTTPAPGDVRRVIEQVRPESRVAIAVAAGLGLRRGETLALRWQSVSLDVRPAIVVEGTLQRADGELIVLPPKTKRSRRKVPLSAGLVTLLKAHRAEQLERRVAAGPAWADGDYVFDRGNGRPVDPDTFSDVFRQARDAIGLDGVRLHDLRHGLATMLVGEGTSVRVVSDLLGHATVAFTLQTYVHPDENESATAVAVAERLLEGVEGG